MRLRGINISPAHWCAGNMSMSRNLHRSRLLPSPLCLAGCPSFESKGFALFLVMRVGELSVCFPRTGTNTGNSSTRSTLRLPPPARCRPVCPPSELERGAEELKRRSRRIHSSLPAAAPPEVCVCDASTQASLLQLPLPLRCVCDASTQASPLQLLLRCVCDHPLKPPRCSSP
jgi:hypothetical protein